MVIVAAHFDTAGTREAVDHQLHYSSRFLELPRVTITGVEFGIRENACAWLTRLVYDLGIQCRIDRQATEAIRDIRSFQVTATNHFLDDRITRDLRIDVIHLAVAKPVYCFHDSGCVILGENANQVTGVDQVYDVAWTVNLGRAQLGIVQRCGQHRVAAGIRVLGTGKCEDRAVGARLCNAVHRIVRVVAGIVVRARRNDRTVNIGFAARCQTCHYAAAKSAVEMKAKPQIEVRVGLAGNWVVQPRHHVARQAHFSIT